MRERGDRREQAKALGNIGARYVDINEPQKAVEYISQALALYRELGVRQGAATSLNNLGALYSDLGEYEKALEYFFQVLPLVRGYQYGEASTLINIGWIYKMKGEPREALKYYNQAAPLAKAAGASRFEVEALDAIGAAYIDLGEAEKALESLQRGLALSREQGLNRQQANVTYHLGEVYASIGEPQKALEHFRLSLSLSRTSRHSILEAATLYGIARVEGVVGALTEARNSIEAALEVAESVRSKIASRELRDSFQASVHDYYEFYIDLLMRLRRSESSAGHDRAALEASERGRARSLLEMLAEARVDIRHGVDPQLLDRERNIRWRINAKAERYGQLLNSKSDEAQAVGKELDSMISELEEVQAQIRKNSPRYAALTQPRTLSVAEIQQSLDDDTLLIEYALGAERSYMWVVTKNDFISSELPKRGEIEAATRRVYDLLTARNHQAQDETLRQRSERIAKADAEYHQSAAALSQMLLGPVASRLARSGKKRLLIVSDGALQYIPFGVLPHPQTERRGDGETGRKGRPRPVAPSPRRPVTYTPLIANHEIVTLPSASTLSVLRQLAGGRQSSENLLAVLADLVFEADDPRVKAQRANQDGPPSSAPAGTFQMTGEAERSARESGVNRFLRLRFTRVEAEAIASLAPEGRKFSALDFVASRATVNQTDLSGFRYLHFATHGLLNSRRPELSGIVLSLVDEQGQPQDGFLRLHEIYNLKLNADLVVLSGCRTALGKEIKGEGLIGLTRGFMHAGAKSVMASLWGVEDRATAELMKRFYAGILGEGLSPSAALCAAQRAMLKDKHRAQPYYWAAFTLQGEWR
jgi:CHAT domain-containing protein/Tfp pilus assembly protein PilF